MANYLLHSKLKWIFKLSVSHVTVWGWTLSTCTRL